MYRSLLAGLFAGALTVGCADETIDTVSGPALRADVVRNAANTDHEIVVTDVELRPGVTADVVITVYVNEAQPCHSPNRTMIALHGATHTAQMFGPLAEELFARGDLCRLAALELPGQGRSSLPRGALYGELGLDEMAAAVIAQLDALAAHNFRSRTLIAHSRGTLLTQYVQQLLLARTSSLRTAYDIRDVVLLNGFGGSNTPWFSRDVLHVWETSLANAVFDPERGWILPVPVEIWLFSWFTNLAGEFHPETPTPAQALAAGYIADEPLQLGLDSAVPGPVIESGIFAPTHGTRLFMVTGTNDFVAIPAEIGVVYEHLTGDASHSGVAIIDDRFAVHSQVIADPAGFVDAVGGR